MLRLAAPQWLWLLLAAPAVILLHLLAFRFRKRPVGSNFIWSRLVEKAAGGRRPRRRSLLLLALQLAAVFLAAVAAAGPRLETLAAAPPGLAILVDVSASMGLRDSGPSGGEPRLGRAAVLALAELGALPPGAPAAVFACGPAFRELSPPGTDRAATARALRSLVPTDGGFDESAAAAGLAAWLAARGEAWTVAVATDGGLDLGGGALASAAGGALRELIVEGGPGEPGVSALRLAQGRDGGLSAEFSVYNPAALHRELSLVLERFPGAGAVGGGAAAAAGGATGAGRRLAARRGLYPPGWSAASLALPGEAGPALVGGYALRLEEAASWAVGGTARLAVDAAAPPRILIVGERDRFVEAALAGAGLAPRRSERFPDAAEARSWDLVVAVRASPPAELPVGLMVFGASPPADPLPPLGLASGALETPPGADPLLRFVDWDGARAEGAATFRAGPGARVLATVGGRAVAAAWERDGHKRFHFGADPGRAGLGLAPAFPVLVRNVLDWFRPPADAQSAYTLVVGETVRRAEAAALVADSPGLEVLREGSLVAVTARSAGFHPFRRNRGEGGTEAALAAANPPASELEARPRSLARGVAAATGAPLAAAPSAGGGAAAPARRLRAESRDLAPWPILALAAALAAEWAVRKGPGKRKASNAS